MHPFLEYKIPDKKYEKEIYEISKIVLSKTNGINDYYPQSSFLKPAGMPEKWPVLQSSFYTQSILEDGEKIFESKIDIFDISNYDSIEEFIQDNQKYGLTHIVVDNYEKRNKILKEIYFQDEDYSFLKKIYDSNKDGFLKYHLKIYEIDYSVLDKK